MNYKTVKNSYLVVQGGKNRQPHLIINVNVNVIIYKKDNLNKKPGGSEWQKLPGKNTF